MDEGQTYDKKSLLTFASDPSRWDWKKIAKHCVALANANGQLREEAVIRHNGKRGIGSRYFIRQKDGK